MCGCSNHQSHKAAGTRQPASGSLTVPVDDMTCGHCAGTISQAIEADLPGTQVHADPATKIVSIRGTTDTDTVRDIISRAGYTPGESAYV
ncbi:heavy-metal-associated domain-containing protein [Microvirga sp. BT325]|uniref:Heavy-metal-associated domain-containing protein n=2 Tax=Microvirga splendida TaxID=2795727 RepID=A0ABS0Y3H0_9HYPH|nr:heavy-metal-associated domain-containing protein [Microvirga splendida]MBJ6126854.1 heavy-metal-associated domain-containing protein [Microvirga splendida]